MKRHYVAVDLGAETGRVVIGSVGDDGIDFEEVHRFANVAVRTPDGLHWNLLGLYAEIGHGLERVAATAAAEIVSVGVDSWGVDYGLFDAAGRLLGNPYHYRDARTDGIRDAFARSVSPAQQYARTGIAQMSINTLYQLVAQAQSGGLPANADALLMIPDIMHFWLTGMRTTESSNASTTGLLGIDGDWAGDILAAGDLPRAIFSAPAEPATRLGPVRHILADSRLRELAVVVPATHDTACAVIAAPLHVAPAGEVCAFISSGTWSLLGLELPAPVVTEAARIAGFTNERGIAGSTRFLRNIMGLWLVAECRRAWRRAGTDFTYDDLTARAALTASPGLIVDVDDPALLHPEDMPAAICAQFTNAGADTCSDPVRLIRAISEGLALAYRRSIADAQRLTGERVGAIAVVGGGARNALLCQLTADACECAVYAGPAEASASGNILVQAVADRALSNLRQIRDFIKTTSRPRVFEPRVETGIDWAQRDARLSEARIARSYATTLER